MHYGYDHSWVGSLGLACHLQQSLHFLNLGSWYLDTIRSVFADGQKLICESSPLDWGQREVEVCGDLAWHFSSQAFYVMKRWVLADVHFGWPQGNDSIEWFWPMRPIYLCGKWEWEEVRVRPGRRDSHSPLARVIGLRETMETFTSVALNLGWCCFRTNVWKWFN